MVFWKRCSANRNVHIIYSVFVRLGKSIIQVGADVRVCLMSRLMRLHDIS
jgi:hypothetical protein